MEIRWHGRGGQGAKTASLLLARIAAAADKYVQAFPEYGPERMGAPVVAYNRIGEQRIRQHCQIEEPGIVVVLDPTLIGVVDVTAGLKENGVLLLNTAQDIKWIKSNLKLADSVRLFIVNAGKISEEELGRVFPNTPMLGVLNEIGDIMDRKEFTSELK
ncbi:MAG: 2-oxoacid:acceptor oxidoreductase family protein, partial [Halanaerobiales bacterium]